MVSNKIAPVLLDICKINIDTKANEINAKQIKAIAYQLNSWKMKIVDTQGFGHAEASGGGVRTIEVDNRTYESKVSEKSIFCWRGLLPIRLTGTAFLFVYIVDFRFSNINHQEKSVFLHIASKGLVSSG